MDCRMFTYYGDAGSAIRLHMALSKAAENDILDGNKSHGNGWGISIISNNEEFYSRRHNPIFRDKFDGLFKNYDGNILVLSHARLASETEQKRGWIDTHPFRISNENEVLYIAHNGYIDKNALAEEFNLNIENLTDTETFAILIQKMGNDFMESIKDVIEFLHRRELKGALNLMCTGYEYSGKKKICYYSDFISKNDYLTLIEYNDDGNFSVMSSTVAYYYGIMDEKMNFMNGKAKVIEKGRIFFREFD